MKKIFVFVMILALMAAMAVPAAASEAVTETAPVTEDDSLVTRLYEVWDSYSAEILSGGGICAMITGLIVFWKKIKPILVGVVSALSTLINGVDDKTKIPTQQSKVLNGIVEGIEGLDKRVDEFSRSVESVKAEREATAEHIKAVERELCALAKAFELAYSNSKLPQGVKDLVSMECAECVKLAETDINGTAPEEAKADEQQV